MNPDQFCEYLLKHLQTAEHEPQQLEIALVLPPEEILHISLNKTSHISSIILDILQKYHAYLLAVSGTENDNESRLLLIEIITPNRHNFFALPIHHKTHHFGEPIKHPHSRFEPEEIKALQEALRRSVFLETT
jgi:hypothetical protein